MPKKHITIKYYTLNSEYGKHHRLTFGLNMLISLVTVFFIMFAFKRLELLSEMSPAFWVGFLLFLCYLILNYLGRSSKTMLVTLNFTNLFRKENPIQVSVYTHEDEFEGWWHDVFLGAVFSFFVFLLMTFFG